MNLPQPFFNSREARTHLARHRLFERGERPTGLVSEAVIQSWMRCLQQRREPTERPEFDPVTASRVHSVLRRNRTLLDVAAGELRELDAALAGTSAVAVLVDSRGVVMHTSHPPSDAQAPLITRACRVGVDLSETAVGTTAPGVVLHVGEPTLVAGAEHFADFVRQMHCAAAPVRDPLGRVVAVLDLSTEGRAFGFDAGWLAERYARGIEYRLLLAMAQRQVVVHLQFDAALLDGPWAGLVGVEADGRVGWLNAAAAAMLGTGDERDTAVGLDAEAVLGIGHTQLERLAEQPWPQRLRLASGLCLWSRCRRIDERPPVEPPLAVVRCADLPAPPCPAEPDPRAAAPTPDEPSDALKEPPSLPLRLRDADHRLVVDTVQACGHNVSRAARQLGVSRGLVYRHLRAAGMAPDRT